MTSDLSTDNAKASGGRSSSDVALEVPNFVHDNAVDSQGAHSSATNPCCERVGKEEKFSAVLQNPEKSCEAAQPFLHQPQTEVRSESFEQLGAVGVQSHFNQDNFSFSTEQITCPVIIEVFCGSARVTASLKELGLVESFGVDHEVGKAIATVRKLDLTLSRDQQIFWQWLKSPLVVGIFWAPPCGTCSLARNIQLRDAYGRKISGPVPLRSRDFPEGLTGLQGRDRRRVSAANKLYEFLAEAIKEAVAMGLIVVVENPRSSLFWLTRFWKSVAKHFNYTAHQACAYGGDRPKWTVLAWNHKRFNQINLCCLGESPSHIHKPWGIVKSERGTHFSTSEEAAYPRGLARAIAKAFADILLNHGWSPPHEFFQVQSDDISLKTMRAIATAQPKASRIPPVVREHKQVVVVRGPTHSLTNMPVEPMQRLKSPLQLPTECESALRVLPEGAQLLRITPLRSKGGIAVQTSSLINGHNNVTEQAWGIPFLPEEFIQEAVSRGHPKLISTLVPPALMEAVFHNFQNTDRGHLPKLRADWFSKWTARANELRAAELELKASMPEHMSKILQPKRLLLWKEILLDLDYPDADVVSELENGTELVGEVPTYGIFEKTFKPAETTVENLCRAAKSIKRKQYYSCRSSGDPEIDELVWKKTQEDVELGWASGPIDIASLPADAIISRRFGLRQPGKIRLIDDLSASNVNQTVQCSESPKPQSIDFVAALLLTILKSSGGAKIKGRSFDLKSAYKQLAIAESSLRFAFVAIYNPYKKKAEVYQLLATPFGATRSVYSFLRISHAIWFTGVKALKIMWSVFFDDYVVFSQDCHVNNTEVTVELLFRLLGWKFAVDGEKATSFDDEFSALGVRINLENAHLGKISFINTEKRIKELSDTIADIIKKGRMTVLESQKLRGRMQFADGQVFGRLGKLCMKAITHHAFNSRSDNLGKQTVEALRRFVIFLEYAGPRSLELASDSVWTIYTDACYEPQRADWICGLGGVLVDPLGKKAAFFSIELSVEQRQALGAEFKKTIIFEAELLAMVLAFSVWKSVIGSSSIICFVDNNSARDVAISGCGRNCVASVLVEFLLKLEMATNVTPWYTRVPTPSNIADDPSRGVIKPLVESGAEGTVPMKELQDIITILLESTVKRGDIE